MPRVTDQDVLLVPDADPQPALDALALFDQPHARLAPVHPIPDDTLGLPEWAGRRRTEVGSNNWVVAGSRTKSGKPMLANDPHLGLQCPGIWYAVRIELPDHWVQGVSIPGIPGVVLGQNERVAWGFTNLGTDVQDLFREPADTERAEPIRIQGATTEAYAVKVGKHGPLVRPGYSLAWAALDPHNLRLPLGALVTALDWESFNTAIDGYTGPAQNVVYADAEGHIGWRASGLLPIRKDGDDGSAPRDGTDASNDWVGFVPQDRMPRVLDPPEGYIATANQRIIGTSFPTPVASEWGPPNRARRIVERITTASAKLDRDAMESIQLDVVSPFHRELAAELVKLVPDSVRDLAGWDGTARASDARFLVAHAWERALRAALRKRVLGDAAASSFEWWNDQAELLAALRADEDAWRRAGLGDKREALAEVERDARAWLASTPQKTWGQFDRLAIKHPFGIGGGALGWIFNPKGFPQDGASSCVRAAQPSFGQSMRLLVDWGAPDATTLVLPLGQSGHLGSAHRTDQQETWRYGDPGGAQTKLAQSATEPGIVLTP
jgi:penicillin amidase